MIGRFKDLVKEGSEEEILLKKIDANNIPVHLAVIMDGNGRWAKEKGLKRVDGHRKGAEIAREITEYALRMGIKYLTLFTFSSENWKRPLKEINMLMNMLHEKLIEEKDLLVKENIKLEILGDITGLPKKLRDKLVETIELSKSHKKMQVNLALNYGGRMEIVNAVKRILEDKIPPQKIDEKLFRGYLYTRNIPDPDLLIRTSGELRISNFLLYQAAYTELYFTKVLWPDFDIAEFFKALLDFRNRARRYGKV
ncbi:MAG: di-trans,poly-cis-decaprenylcistransferase [Candidatus Aminicenantes bacterium]|nr:di-trans,poly-cis-decaprenylcistransferase [Candidatus Aminicenantes bacterium]